MVRHGSAWPLFYALNEENPPVNYSYVLRFDSAERPDTIRGHLVRDSVATTRNPAFRPDRDRWRRQQREADFFRSPHPDRYLASREKSGSLSVTSSGSTRPPDGEIPEYLPTDQSARSDRCRPDRSCIPVPAGPSEHNPAPQHHRFRRIRIRPADRRAATARSRRRSSDPGLVPSSSSHQCSRIGSTSPEPVNQ